MTARYAAVDIGSNSCRLMVTDAGGTVLERRLVTTRLGRTPGHLDAESITRTLAALTDFSQLVVGAEVFAVATSAVREAANSKEFLIAAEGALGSSIEVVTGAEEGRLAFLGATSKFSNGTTAVIDVGGGSTEVAIGIPGASPDVVSFPVGAVRLTEQALASGDPDAREVNAARSLVHQAMVGWGPGRVDRVVAVAGTATSIAALVTRVAEWAPGCVDGVSVSEAALDDCIRLLTTMSREERQRHPFIAPGRQDILLGGALVLAVVLDLLKSALFEVSERDILEGLLLDRFSVLAADV